MRLRQLRNFATVCELGSITKAAEKLHIAQPALGVQMRGLEDEMGAQLLERNPRGVSVTPAGERVLQWAREVLQSEARLKNDLHAASETMSGPLTLGLTPSVATLFAMPILTRVMEDLPKVQLQLVENIGNALVEQVDAGQLDLAMVFDSEDAMPAGSGPVLRDQLYFVTAPDAGAAGRESIELEEVMEQPLVLPAVVDSIRRIAETAARAANLPFPLKYEVRSPAIILNLVRQGFANAIMPLPMVVEAMAQGQVSARRIVSPTLDRYLFWVRSKSSTHAQSTREIEQLIADTIRQETVGKPWAVAFHFD